jgi:TonB family protein
MPALTRSYLRPLKVLTISLAIHAGIIGALWAIIHTNPAILSELNPAGWSSLPIELEGSQRGAPSTARKRTIPSEEPSASNSQSTDHSAHTANTSPESKPLHIGTSFTANKPLDGSKSLDSNGTAPTSENLTLRGDATKTIGDAVRVGQGDPYFSQVRSRIQSQIHYTPAMARRRLQGQVQIALTLLADGSIASLNIQKSSGSPELDQRALNSVRAATPFPSFSSAAPARKLELPIDFRLN